jgi:hypothetical protein
MKESPLFPTAVTLLAFLLVLPPAVLAGTISFHPSSIVLYADGNGSVTVTIDELPEGLSGYYLTANVTNPEVAEISGVTFPGWTSLNTATTVPSSQIRIEGADVEDQVVAGATNVELATIALRAKNPGSAVLNLHSININDDSGMLIEPTVNAASITVTSSSGSWSAGGGSGSSSGTGSSGEGSGGSAGTSVSGDTNDGTLPARTGSTTERSDGPSGGSDSQGTSPDGSAAVDTSVGLPTQVPSPAGSLPIPSLWIIVIAIMVGAAATVFYLAFTRRI